MTSERYAAYRTLLDTLVELAPALLDEQEAALLRDLAEGLLLSRDRNEAEELTRQAKMAVRTIARSRDWPRWCVDAVLAELEACAGAPLVQA